MNKTTEKNHGGGDEENNDEPAVQVDHPLLFPPGGGWHCGKAQTDWRNMLPVRERGETTLEKCLDIPV